MVLRIARTLRRLLRQIGSRHRGIRHAVVQPVLNSVSISMIRNEQDLIEPFLRHHAALFDLMVVLDNRSTDQTREIAGRVARELGNIIIADCPDEGYNQARIMTDALFGVQSVCFADYIFFLDADEFLLCIDREDLNFRLKAIPPGGMGLMPWRTFVPDPTLDEDEYPDPLDRMKLCRQKEQPVYYKAIYRPAGGLDSRVTVAQGNHMLYDAMGEALPKIVLESFPLSHFPLRSTEQLAAKGVIGWRSNLRRDDLQPKAEIAYQWKELHDQVVSGLRLDRATLANQAINYAWRGPTQSFPQDAMICDHGISVPRRYSDGRFAVADRLIAAASRSEVPWPSIFQVPPPPSGTGSQSDIPNAFQGAWHWEFMFLDVPLVRFLIERLTPFSVLDLGCGNGLYPLLYRHLGVTEVFAVDGIPREATVLDETTYLNADLQKPIDLERRFDLVVCLEVVEHVLPETTDVLLDNIARHANGIILFSMAEPGQPGNGHINCRSMEEVLDFWQKRGWQPDLALTLGARALSSMSWFRRNLVVLRSDGVGEAVAARTALLRISELPYEWWGQQPGQRNYPFRERPTGSGAGYGLRMPWKQHY